MTDTILRLRGDAESVSWPAMLLAPLVDRCDELRARTPVSPSFEALPAERRAAHAYSRKWEWELTAAHQASVDAFAAAQGWTRAKTDFRVVRLLPPKMRTGGSLLPRWVRDDVFEHPNWLRDGRRCAGVVVHLYREIRLDKLPEPIVVDELPRSWYYPQWTKAYLLRPQMRRSSAP
jgi:hypothetical protein